MYRRKICPLLFTILITFLHVDSLYAQNKSDSSSLVPWDYIKPEDMLWHKWVVREAPVYQRSNAVLRNCAAIPKENNLANVLLSGIVNDKITAYADTAFAHPLGRKNMDTLIKCDAASLSKITRAHLNRFSRHNGDTSIYDTSAILSCIYPEQVEAYYLLEDWLFDRNKGQMIVRIRAIAPVAYINGAKKPLFWLHYQDIRQYISNYGVYDSSHTARYTWNEYFESRQFSSKIITIDGGNLNERKENKTRKNKHKRDEDSTSVQDIWVY